MNRRAVFTRAPDTLPAVKREALAVNNQVIYLPRQLQSGSVFVTLFEPVLCICIFLRTDLGFQSAKPFKENLYKYSHVFSRSVYLQCFSFFARLLAP